MAPPQTKLTKLKRRRRRAIAHDGDSEDERMKQRLQAKFGRHKRSHKRGDETGNAVVRAAKGITVRNPGQHQMLIDRAEEMQSSRLAQAETRPGHLEGAWRCALCQQRSLQGDLGDLFGPYFVRLSPDHQWPTFLVKRPAKVSRNEELWLDIWLHGDCALWADDVQLAANRLLGLQEKMNVFWGQCCCICGKEGAAITTDDGKFVHFPCAEQKGYDMNESLLSCRSPKRERAKK